MKTMIKGFQKSIKISMLTLTLAMMSFTVPSTQINGSRILTGNISIIWKSDQIDLGEIPQNKPKTIEFEFVNKGNTTLLITNVKVSCGCTATEYTKTPIEPGSSAKITATYNAASKGMFSKTVTVTTNGDENPKVLTFKGTVL